MTPRRSLRAVIPARQKAMHRQVRVRAQADRIWHPSFHQWFQSMSGLLAGGLDIPVLGGGQRPRNGIADRCSTGNPKGGLLSQKRIQRIKQTIDRVKRTLLEIGRMRPASLTRQFRREWVKELRRQVVTHKRFRRLVDQCTDLSIEHSRLSMRIAEPTEPRKIG